MTIPIYLYKLKRILYDQKAFFISLGVFVLLFFIVLIIYAKFNSQKKEVDLMSNEVVMLKNRYDTLKYNKSLTEDQIKEYNKLLASLVPETEDYFSIIYAIEEISKESHFSITDYTIDVSSTTKEKLTLSVAGQGDTDAFLSFLQEYQYAGGRLATIDKIQYGGITAGNTRIALNFYSKRFTFNESVQVPQLNKEEIEKLEAIRKKVKFQFSSSGYQSIKTDYRMKNDPFSAAN
jgi:hypothetical protein